MSRALTDHIMEDSTRARIRSILAILFLPSFFATAPVQAQVTTADLIGTVTDSSGAVVVSAQVTATNEGTAQARSAQTDASGNYLISQLHPGRYTLSCELAGFKKLVCQPEAQYRLQITECITSGGN